MTAAGEHYRHSPIKTARFKLTGLFQLSFSENSTELPTSWSSSSLSATLLLFSAELPLMEGQLVCSIGSGSFMLTFFFKNLFPRELKSLLDLLENGLSSEVLRSESFSEMSSSNFLYINKTMEKLANKTGEVLKAAECVIPHSMSVLKFCQSLQCCASWHLRLHRLRLCHHTCWFDIALCIFTSWGFFL